MSESREERPPHDADDVRGGGGTGGGPGTEAQDEWAAKKVLKEQAKEKEDAAGTEATEGD